MNEIPGHIASSYSKPNACIMKPDLLRREHVYGGRTSKEGYEPRKLEEKIVQEGQDPFTYIANRVKEGIRIIGVGEIHLTETEYLRTKLLHAVTQVPDVKVGSIALEINTKSQPSIDEFMQTGNMGKLYRKLIFQSSAAGLAVVKYAREHGIKVVCVDGKEKTPYVRDETMHRRIADIAQIDPDHVTIAFLGNNHVSHEHFPTPTGQTYQKLSDMYPPEMYLSIQQDALPVGLTKRIKRNVLIPVGDDELFNKTLSTIGNDPYGNARAILFTPIRNVRNLTSSKPERWSIESR